MDESVRKSRRRTNTNRARILDAARGCFAHDPDASMDDVARAAGVVRRTVYAHFPNRDTLIEGLADEAGAALAAALDFPEPDDPALALAVGALHIWPVGDRYRMLLSFARKVVGEERIAELISPMYNRTRDVVERGRANGDFVTEQPTLVLVGLMEGLTMATLEMVNRGLVDDGGETIAIAVLALAGIGSDRAAEVVRAARSWLDENSRDAPPEMR